MRRVLMLVLVVALGALLFAPAAFAQDDNPSGEDIRGGGERAFDDNPSRDDLGADDRGEVRGFDDDPMGDDAGESPTASATASAMPTASASSTASATVTASASPSASATSSASSSPRADDGAALPDTGGVVPLTMVAGMVLVGGGIASVMLLRRAS